MVPRLGTVSFKVWELAVPCHDNLWFPRWEPSVPTFSIWGLCRCNCWSSTVFRQGKVHQTGGLHRQLERSSVSCQMQVQQFTRGSNYQGNLFLGRKPQHDVLAGESAQLLQSSRCTLQGRNSVVSRNPTFQDESYGSMDEMSGRIQPKSVLWGRCETSLSH